MFEDAFGQQHAPVDGQARIVSLVPSVTELLFALGLAEQVVGRTGFCVHPREEVRNVAKLGGTKDVDMPGLLALHPTHVIVNIDENTRPLFDALRAAMPHVIVTHPNSPHDNLALYELLGGIFRCAEAAERLAGELRNGLAQLESIRKDLPARSVAYLIWRDPWMSVANDTYIARMLELINWQVVAANSPARYPELDDAELAGLDLDMVLLSSEPYPFRDKHIKQVEALCDASGAVHLVDGEMLSWYGSRAIAGLAYLRGLANSLCVKAA